MTNSIDRITFNCGHSRTYSGHFDSEQRAILQSQLCTACISAPARARPMCSCGHDSEAHRAEKGACSGYFTPCGCKAFWLDGVTTTPRPGAY